MAAFAASCTGVIGERSDDGPVGASTNGDTGGTTSAGGTGGGPQGIECQPGLTACGLECVNLQTSAVHCGACSAACALGTLCSQGECGTECAAPYTECEGACVDTRTDASHCGDCGRPCTDGTPCFGGDCGCPEGTLICGGQCVDPSSDPVHCGGCDSPCEGDELCTDGSCVPAPGGCTQTDCNGACVDTDTSIAHCGDCDQQCSSGQRCTEGTCECTDPEAELCGTRCVYPEEDVDNCGSCGNVCTDGLPCTDGVCACPEGQEPCAGACVDTESSVLHCGACGAPCPEDETCVAGQCSGSVGDDCTNVLATGITIREIAVLQAGKVSIMNGGAAVDDRVADVIAGKDGFVRVYVDTDGSFSSRVLSARLSLMEGEELEQVFHKRTVSGSSTEATWGSTFNIEVPGELITPSTNYVVEIVECDTSTGGSPATPKYPASGTAALSARDVGRMRLEYIPLHAPNGSPPDVSAARLDGYTAYLEAMYPVAGVDYTVGEPLNISASISAQGSGWEEALVQLRQRHEQDDAPNDLYYYGLFEPSSSTYCNSGCVAGIGYVPSANGGSRHHRVSLGLSRGSRGSAETMAHEIGHNHGRPHSPCGGVSDPDPGYPHSGAQIGWWGFEPTNTLHAPNRTDIMGYCSDQWVSDYVYRLLTDRVATINGFTAFRAVDRPVATWRVVLTGRRGPRWVAPYTRPTEAAGSAEPAEILDDQGNPLLQVTVYRTPMDHLDAAEVMVPEPQPGWSAIVLQGEPPLRFDAVTTSLP